MAEKDIQLRINAAIEAAEAAKTMGQMRKAMLELIELQGDIGDKSSENFGKLSEAASKTSQKLAETRDAIGDIQDKTRTLEGTAVEKLSGSFGLLKESILNLDFDKAKIAFEGFNSVASDALDGLKSGATGAFGAMKNGLSAFASNPLGALANGFKGLGSSIISVGKAILGNPIFLLAAIITAIVVAVVKFMDSLGLLKPILDVIKSAIGFVVDGFKALTDWLGLTSHAAEEAAQAQADAAERTAKATKNYTDKRIQDIDHEIKMMELQGKSAEDLEKKKLYLLKNTADKERIAAMEALKAAKKKGDVDKEELEKLQDRVHQTKLAYDKSINDIKYFNASVKKEQDDFKKEQDKKAAEDAAKEKAERTAKYKEYLAKQKEFNQNRRDADRQAEDLRISLIEDDFEREIELNKVKYKRLIEDTMANEKLLGDEKKELKGYYDNLQKQDEQKIRDDKAKKEDEELQREYEKADAQYKMLEELRMTDKEKEIADLVASYEEKYALAEGNAELEKALMEQQKADIAAIDDKYRKEKEEKDKEAAEKARLLKIKEYEDAAEWASKGANAVQGIADAVFAFKKRNLEKGSAEEEKVAKKQFKVNKALQLGLAVIDGFKAVTTSLAQSPIAIGPIPNPAGIASLAFAAITSATNIAKIAASKFEGGGGGAGGASTPSVPTGGGGEGGAPSFQAPQFFGLGQTTASTGGAGQQNMKVFVTEGDISKTQNRVRVIEERAKIV